ncbi:hypothetical protein HY546_00255 [archaeon]|nr:hypothetical protein [archaeon]
MQETIQLPIIYVEGKKWILLKHLDEKIRFRGASIQKPYQVAEPNQHRLFESIAEGSAKCRPKRESIDF